MNATANFADCLSAPGQSTQSGCESADIDMDGDADLADFGALQAAYGCQ